MGTSVGQGTVAGASQATLHKGQAQAQAQVGEANGEDEGRQRKTKEDKGRHSDECNHGDEQLQTPATATATVDRAMVHRYGLGASRLFTLVYACTLMPRFAVPEMNFWKHGPPATLHRGWIAPPLLWERAVHAANLTSLNLCGPCS